MADSISGRWACAGCVLLVMLAASPAWARATHPHTDCADSTDRKDCVYGTVPNSSQAGSATRPQPAPPAADDTRAGSGGKPVR